MDCGIDLGSTFSKISRYSEAEKRVVPIACDEGDCAVPSVVYYPKRGAVPIVGNAADNAKSMRPERACLAVKRALGRENWTFSLEEGEDYTPTEVAAEIFKKLVREAEECVGERVGEVTIAVPASFAQAERHAMREAAVLAGLDQGKMTFVREPEAIALAFYADPGRDGAHGDILVCDLGGGTLDVALLHPRDSTDDDESAPEFDTLHVGGDRDLGGSQWSEILAEIVAEKLHAAYGVDPRASSQAWAFLMEQAETGKKMLSRVPTISVVGDRDLHQVDISRQEFEDATSALLQKVESIIERALGEIDRYGTAQRDSIDLILAGGASRMPMVIEMISRLIGKAPLKHANPDFLTSMGAAYAARAFGAARYGGGDLGLVSQREDTAAHPSVGGTAETPDVFISYRRQDGAQTARLLRAELQHRGYRVFLDVDDLRPGHFDEALLKQIDAAPNFVLVLSPDSLRRCSDDRDWLRREVAHAMQAAKNIVPIIMTGFEFPEQDELPMDIAQLSLHHGIPYSHDFFDAMMDKLAGYLKP